MNRYSRDRYVCLILGALLFLVSQMSVAEVTARVSRNPIALNESVELLFESDRAPDNEPDFSSVEEDFEVVNRNKSQSVQLINGDMSRRITWQLTLIPKHAGQLEIPEIDFGGDRSKSIMLTVSESQSPDLAGDDQPLFVKMVPSEVQTYVQQQVLLKVQLFSSIGIGDASLSAPDVKNADVVIKPLGEAWVDRGTA